MRVLSFIANGSPGYGVAVDGGVVDCSRHLGEGSDLRGLLLADGLGRLDRFATAPADYRLDEIRFLPPIGNPAAKFLCIGINYRPHMLEMGRDVPEHPVIFVRFANSLVGHGEALTLPRASERFDYEGELAVIIGRRARHVTQAQALDHVAGYSCFNDGSVRDYQRHSSQFTPGKNFVGSGAFGPWLVTGDELRDPAALRLETRLNGETVQSESTGELHFSIATLVEYISTWTELVPGDVIVTGTPGGVGAGRTPPLWMRAGDTVEVELSGIGCLRNPVIAEDAA
jgi:2-keto-4-pentenoate hydratase/2-oxohepta-3-ene-1,7-dioic acid hydratase in catechol pathway